tara:strand:- start:3171 stop:3539 length:369 start_codon:yes stop_codon:yes gene_type:complete
MDTYTVKLTGAFVTMILPILEDAASHRATWADQPAHGRILDPVLADLAEVYDAVEEAGVGYKVTLSAAGLDALQREAEYRIDWALDEAGVEYGAERLAWHSKARSAKATVARIIKVRGGDIV